MKLKRYLFYAFVIILLLIGAISLWVPTLLEQQMNKTLDHPPYVISDAARELHSRLVIGDWHADSALWDRNLGKNHHFGHVDIPRLQAGNVAIQMFTTVTKSPSGLNYESNAADATDSITQLAVVQGWPISTWQNLTERALYQANKIKQLAVDYPDTFRLVLNQQDLTEFIQQRNQSPSLVAGLIGTEGSHALQGDLSNIDKLYAAGFRMMSLQHFFDNALGGSLHGLSGKGLTEFGRQALVKMQQMDIIVDLSHSSEQTVKDSLALTTKPVVISHTGFKGHCDTQRNIDDNLMRQIAQQGGLIAVGYWDEAVCGTSPADIAASIKYGIELIGADHVALGSDFDGAVTTALDTSELIAITQALMDLGIDEQSIAKVMGGNMLAFLQHHLPKQ